MTAAAPGTRANEKKITTEWGEGVLSVVANEAIDFTSAHHQAQVKAPRPFGCLTSDLAFRRGERLLVIERQGSGPGNIHDLYRWFHVVSNGYPIEIKPRIGSRPSSCNCQSVDVVINLGRPTRKPNGDERWSESDFVKTVAYCESLGQLLERQPLSKPMRFHILRAPETVAHDAWYEVGCVFGREILSLFDRRD